MQPRLVTGLMELNNQDRVESLESIHGSVYHAAFRTLHIHFYEVESNLLASYEIVE